MSYLGRRIPSTDVLAEKMSKYPYMAVAPETVAKVETTLRLPPWHKTHNQARTNSCTGHMLVMERAITNARQSWLLSHIFPPTRYNPLVPWQYAKGIDEWGDTVPGDNNGTSVHAVYDAARAIGLNPVQRMVVDHATSYPTPIGEKEPNLKAGQQVTRWASSIDEIRTCIASRQAVGIGINWYSGFDNPYQAVSKEWWLPKPPGFSTLRGGHAITLYGASDRRQAFKMKNNWLNWPLVWLPYESMEKLLNEDGEVAIVTDA